MNALFEDLSQHAAGLLRKRSRPGWSDPTLATLVHEPFDHPDWLFEPKMDGQRCLIVKHGSRVRILSRNNGSLDATYPELREAVSGRVGPDCVLDGEVVAFSGNTTSFARLQQRMQLADAADVGSSGVAVYCYLFDLLHVAGHDTTPLPLRERKKLLARTTEFTDPLCWTPYENHSGRRYHRGACAAGWEGTLAKDATAAYHHGRSRCWLKFKCVNDQELVVGGFTEPAGSRPALGALLVGYYDEGRFVYAGKVGTGFTTRTLRELRAELGRLERAESPFAEEVTESGAHWVEPRTVVSIAFTEWTADGRLRHPSYRGLRRDKDASDVTGENR